MGKLQKNQNGFSAVEGVLILVIVGLIGFAGWYVWHSNKKMNKLTSVSTSQAAKSDTQKQPPQSAASKKYLSIPEEGIKFQLSSEIEDAYYFKSQQGYIYLSTHRLDNTKGGEGCAATDSDGLGGGLIALVVGKVGESNDSIGSGAPWTQEELDASGLTKIGDTYYGFQHGNGPCWNVDNAGVAELGDNTIKAFTKQQSTITKQ